MHPWKKKKLRRQRRKARADKSGKKPAKPQPEQEPSNLYETTSDGYECLLCGHTLKTESGIQSHIEQKHPAE